MKSGFLVLALLGASSYAQTGTFTATGNMTAPGFDHTATLLPDGRVLITGGFTACVIGSRCLGADLAELYDPGTGIFTAAFPDFLPGGRVLIAGYTVQVLDPSTDVLLNDGRVLHSGYRNAELYDPISGTSSPVANWPGQDFRGDDPAASEWWYPVLLADGKVLLAPYEASGCKIYDPAIGAFSPTGALGYFLGLPHRTLLLNGAVLFTGGSDDFGNVNSAKLYDPVAGTFASKASMSTPKQEHSATLLPDGTVLVAGGAGQSGCMQPPLTNAEIYDPATSGFSTTRSLAWARHAHTATLLNNGQVLITGGTAFIGGCDSKVGSSINGMSSAELYTPAVLVPAPVLFSRPGDGNGQGAIWHAQTGQIASDASPAIAGEALSMYTTNLVDGGVIPPQVTIGGRVAEVLYFGASGYPGYNQVNFRVPSGVAPGSAVPLRLNYIGRSSNQVTLGVR